MAMEPCACGAEDCPRCGLLYGTRNEPIPWDEDDIDTAPSDDALPGWRQDDMGTAYTADRFLRDPRPEDERPVTCDGPCCTSSGGRTP